MKIKKKHILISALILALSAAVYLNWRFSFEPDSLTAKTVKELGAATYVSAEAEATGDEKAVSKDITEAEAYFAKAKTERKQAEDAALSAAKEVLKLAESSDEAKAEAVKQADMIENRILAESNVETVLLSKGFSKCVCVISDSGCTVSVLKDEHKDGSALLIKDAVLSQTDFDFDDITIIDI